MKVIRADEYEEKKNLWIDKKCCEFLSAVESIVSDDDFVLEIAESIAWSHYNDENCKKFFSSHNMNWDNAVCYLSSITNLYRYEDEVDKAFNEMLSNYD